MLVICHRLLGTRPGANFYQPEFFLQTNGLAYFYAASVTKEKMLFANWMLGVGRKDLRTRPGCKPITRIIGSFFIA